MTDAERDTIREGDTVMVRSDSGKDHEYTVKYAPWALCDGVRVIGLDGISGGYLLSRVVRIVRRAANDTQ